MKINEYLTLKTPRIRKTSWGNWYSLYSCICGSEFETLEKHVKSGATKSCGCRQQITHPKRFDTKTIYKAHWYKENRERINKQFRKSHLKRMYGITEGEYAELVNEQSGKCAICLVPPTRKFHIDHSHNTGLIRGLLCHSCNMLLGFAKDNQDILLNAIKYLKGLTNI